MDSNQERKGWFGWIVLDVSFFFVAALSLSLSVLISSMLYVHCVIYLSKKQNHILLENMAWNSHSISLTWFYKDFQPPAVLIKCRAACLTGLCVRLHCSQRLLHPDWTSHGFGSAMRRRDPFPHWVLQQGSQYNATIYCIYYYTYNVIYTVASQNSSSQHSSSSIAASLADVQVSWNNLMALDSSPIEVEIVPRQSPWFNTSRLETVGCPWGNIMATSQAWYQCAGTKDSISAEASEQSAGSEEEVRVPSCTDRVPANLHQMPLNLTCLFWLSSVAQIEDLILRWLDVCGGVQPDPFRGRWSWIHVRLYLASFITMHYHSASLLHILHAAAITI